MHSELNAHAIQRRTELLNYVNEAASTEVAENVARHLHDYDAAITSVHQAALNEWLNNAAFDGEKVRQMILQYLSVHQPPSMDDSEKLMAKSEEDLALTAEEERQIGLFLLAQDDLQPHLINVLSDLLPVMRENLLGLITPATPAPTETILPEDQA